MKAEDIQGLRDSLKVLEENGEGDCTQAKQAREVLRMVALEDVLAQRMSSFGVLGYEIHGDDGEVLHEAEWDSEGRVARE